MEPWMILLCVLGGLLLAAVLIISAVVYKMAFWSPKRRRDPYYIPEGDVYEPYRQDVKRWVAAFEARPCERVSITSHDGLRLSARYYHTADGAPLAIACHGYRSAALLDFCGGGVMAMDVLGHNLLLIDQRAHGESRGRNITFGIREQYDVLDWIAYATERFGTDLRIVLYGISMGAATAVMTAGLPELVPQVKGVVADCPYSSPAEIICKVCRDIGIPPAIGYPFACIGAALYGGFRLSRRGPHSMSGAKNAKIPILLFHGLGDDFVPASMSEAIYAANPEMVRLHLFPDAVHAGCYLKHPERYRAEVISFMKEIDCMGRSDG